MNNNYKIIFILLLTGFLYRIVLTAGGNFLFNMDNARDMVDVREMMVLNKLRLTGPTSAIDGFFNGPAWYYLLAFPFLLSGGDPYASILMENVLWAIGGFFLLKLVGKWSTWSMLPVGLIWIASDYIVLANFYAFNPNPVTFLTPLFIFLLVEYLKNYRAIYAISTWFLAGLFFNFEMNFGVFIPLVILSSIILTKNVIIIKQKWFWAGVASFILTLLPQIIFDLRHQFIMSKAVFRHLAENSTGSFDLFSRFQSVLTSFYSTFLPTLMNQKILAWVILGLTATMLYGFIKKKEKDTTVLVSLFIILIPFLGYLVLPVSINPWHLGAEMSASILLMGYVLKELTKSGLFGKVISVVVSSLIIIYSLSNIGNFFINDWGKANLDPSLYKNEIAAIDYVYKYAKGQNFKVYAYLPSVIDYPYQYLFWWYGNKKYGYIPGEYVYSPNKPQYISNKEKFDGRKDNFSGLVFLIKEPDRIKMRQAWENDYQEMKFISKEMVGPLEVEIRKQ